MNRSYWSYRPQMRGYCNYDYQNRHSFRPRKFNGVCWFWAEGTCPRYNCPFVHHRAETSVALHDNKSTKYDNHQSRTISKTYSTKSQDQPGETNVGKKTGDSESSPNIKPEDNKENSSGRKRKRKWNVSDKGEGNTISEKARGNVSEIQKDPASVSKKLQNQIMSCNSKHEDKQEAADLGEHQTKVSIAESEDKQEKPNLGYETMASNTQPEDKQEQANATKKSKTKPTETSVDKQEYANVSNQSKVSDAQPLDKAEPANASKKSHHHMENSNTQSMNELQPANISIKIQHHMKDCNSESGVKQEKPGNASDSRLDDQENHRKLQKLDNAEDVFKSKSQDQAERKRASKDLDWSASKTSQDGCKTKPKDQQEPTRTKWQDQPESASVTKVILKDVQEQATVPTKSQEEEHSADISIKSDEAPESQGEVHSVEAQSMNCREPAIFSKQSGDILCSVSVCNVRPLEGERSGYVSTTIYLEDLPGPNKESSPTVCNLPESAPSIFEVQELSVDIQEYTKPLHTPRRISEKTETVSELSRDGGLDEVHKTSNDEELSAITATNRLILTSTLRGNTTPEITGIAVVPSLNEGDKCFYTIGRHANLRRWDAVNRICTDTHYIPDSATCMLNTAVKLFCEKGIEYMWLFIGTVKGQVIAWNINKEIRFLKPSTSIRCGEVTSLTHASGNLVIAGMANGDIWVWAWNTRSTLFDLYAVLHGHISSVLTLETNQSHKNIVSGDGDGEIRVWDITTARCIGFVSAHNSAVTKILYWDNGFYISCSLDGTLKVWGPSDFNVGDTQISTSLQLHYVHKMYDVDAKDSKVISVLSMCGIVDQQQKTILLVSLSNCKVHVLQLPTFKLIDSINVNSPVHTLEPLKPNLMLMTSIDGTTSVYDWVTECLLR